MNLGYYRDSKKLVPLTNERRFAHTHLIGKRAGKTTALINYILDDIAAGEGLLFVDPIGTAIDEILKRIPEHRADNIILLNFGDLEYPPGLNIFHNISRERHARVAGTLVEIARSIWDYGKSPTPRLNLYLRAAARVMLSVPHGNLFGVYYLITSPRHRKRYLSFVKDAIVKDIWERYGEKKEKDQADLTDSMLTRIVEIVSDPVMRNIVGQSKTAVDFREILHGRKVVLASIPESVLGHDTSRMLGSILLGLMQLAALERDDRTPFHIYLDRAEHFAGTHLAEMLDSTGDYGVSITLAHRYLGQFEPDFQRALLGSAGTLVCFQVGPTDAEIIRPMFEFNQNDLYPELTNIPPYRAYGRTGGRAQLLTMPDLPEETNVAKRIRRHCRTKYGRRREQVEREIAAFIGEA
jgi:hypothetical protein